VFMVATMTLAAAAPAASAAPTTWTTVSTKTFGEGSTAADRVLVDVAGNSYVAGRFKGTVIFGPGAAGTLTATGSGWLFVASYAPDGSFRWVRKIGNGVADRVAGLVRLPNGNILLYGQVYGSARITSVFGDTVLPGHGGSDVYLVSLRPNDGLLVWARQDGGPENELAGAVAVDQAAQIYTVGSFRGSAVFAGTGGPTTLTSDGLNDGFLAKFNGTAPGGLISAHNIAHGPQNDDLTTVAVGSGMLVAGGSWRGSSTVAGAAVTAYSVSSFLVRLTPSAPSSRIWLRLLKGNDQSVLSGSAFAYDGTIYLGGTLHGPTQFFNYGAITPTATRTPAGSSDAFVASYAPNGALQWATLAGGDSTAWAGALAVGWDNSVLMAGSFQGTIELGGANLAAVGGKDVFLGNWGVTGDVVRAASWGGADNDEGRGVTVSHDFTGTYPFVVGTLGQGEVIFPGGTSVTSTQPRGFLAELAPI